MRNNRIIEKRVILSLEVLADRTTPAILYADDNFLITNDVLPAGLSAGDTVTFAPGEATEVENLTYEGNAFRAITAAVLNAKAGDTIRIGAGYYDDRIVTIAASNLTIDIPAGVLAFMGFKLAPGVANAKLTGAGTAVLSGNNSNNILIGNSGNNDLDAGSGNEIIDGGDGIDTAVILVDGSFATASAVGSGGTRTSALAVGNLNADSFPDIAVTIIVPGIGVLLGNGDGGFDSPTTYSSGGESPTAVALGDVNRDGYTDILVANESIPYGVGVLLGNGDGTFANPAIFNYGGVFAYSIALGDFNCDNKIDLVVTHYNGFNNIAVMFGNGNGTFGAPVLIGSGGGYPYSVIVNDVNYDEHLDLLVVNLETNNVTVLLGNGNGTFGIATSFGTGGVWPQSIAVGDFNADGKTDLVVGNQFANNGGGLGDKGNVGVLMGNGDGTFTKASTFASGGHFPYMVAVGDVNGDNNLDIALTNYRSGTAGVLLGKGDGSFTIAPMAQTGGSPKSVAISDLNADGKPDLIVTNNDDVRVLLGNGRGGNYGDYSIGHGDTNMTVTGPSGQLTLSNIEKLQFADKTVLLVGHPGSAYTTATAGVADANSGDIVNVAPGVYSDGLVTSNVNNVTLEIPAGVSGLTRPRPQPQEGLNKKGVLLSDGSYHTATGAKRHEPLLRTIHEEHCIDAMLF